MIKKVIFSTLVALFLFSSSASADRLIFLPYKPMPVKIYQKGSACVWDKMPNWIFYYGQTEGRPSKVSIGGRNARQVLGRYEWRVAQKFSPRQVRQRLYAKRPSRMMLKAEKGRFTAARVVYFKTYRCGKGY